MAIAGYNSRFLVTSKPSVALMSEGCTDAGDHKVYTITDQLKRYLDNSVAAAIETSTDGTNWASIASGFQIYYVNARVVFPTAQAANLQVRFANAKYYPWVQFGDAASVEFQGKTDMIDVTKFNPDGTHSFIPGLVTGTLKCSSWWTNKARVQALLDRDLLIISFVTPVGNRYEGYCYTSDSSLKADPKSAISEDLTFQLTDEFFSN